MSGCWPSARPTAACEVRRLLSRPPGFRAALDKGFSENRFEEKLKLLMQPQLLIDEIGYIPIDPRTPRAR